MAEVSKDMIENNNKYLIEMYSYGIMEIIV